MIRFECLIITNIKPLAKGHQIILASHSQPPPPALVCTGKSVFAATLKDTAPLTAVSQLYRWFSVSYPVSFLLQSLCVCHRFLWPISFLPFYDYMFTMHHNYLHRGDWYAYISLLNHFQIPLTLYFDMVDSPLPSWSLKIFLCKEAHFCLFTQVLN